MFPTIRSNILSSHLLSKNIKIHNKHSIIILFVVLYGCETVSDIDEHRLRVFDNRVMNILRPKRDEVMGAWRILHNKWLHDLYSSPSIIRITMSRRMR
jgi:hypothetical protein